MICSQRKPSSARCSAQSVGSRAVSRINFMALSCGGCRAIDDSRGDIRRQPGKAQEGVDVGGGDPFSARNVMHGQLRVLNEPCLDVVSASDNPKQARIG